MGHRRTFSLRVRWSYVVQGKLVVGLWLAGEPQMISLGAPQGQDDPQKNKKKIEALHPLGPHGPIHRGPTSGYLQLSSYRSQGGSYLVILAPGSDLAPACDYVSLQSKLKAY